MPASQSGATPFLLSILAGNLLDLGNTQVKQAGFSFYNDTGSTLVAGTLVYLNSFVSGRGPTVLKADGDASNTPAEFVVVDDTANGTMGSLARAATIKVASFDTSGSSVGAAVYLSTTPGGVTLTSGTAQVGVVANPLSTSGTVYFNLIGFTATSGGGGAQILAPDGTQALPGFAFSGSGGADDGLYRPANNTVAFSLAGLRRLIVATSSPSFAASADSVGNDVYLAASAAGLSATAARVGGLVDFRAGAGSAGTTTIAGGAGGVFTSGAGAGGAKSGTTGDAGAGGAWTGTGGAGGANASTTSGNGGAGGIGAITGGAGGNSTSTSSTGNGGAGGNATATGGAGGTAAGTVSGAGGAGGGFVGQAGDGGGAANGNGGAGGTATVKAGAGGASSAGTGNGGNGGNAVVVAGAGGGTAGGAGGTGGTVKLQPGAGGGAGSAGVVMVSGTAPMPFLQNVAISTLADTDATVTTTDVRNGIMTVAVGATNRTKTTPTAAQLVSAFPGIQIGSMITFSIVNLKAANTVTVGLGASVTNPSSCNLVVAANVSATFALVATNVTLSSEAFSIYRIAG